MPHDNILFWIITTITEITDRYTNPFMGVALEWWFDIARVMVVVVAARILLGGDAVGKTIAIFTFRLVGSRYLIYSYDSSFMGTGVSFHKTITSTGAELANLIDHSISDRLVAKFGDLITGMQPPGVGNLITNSAGWIHYWFIVGATGLMQGVCLFVISFGLVCIAVLVVIGPLTIPFLLVPRMEWITWGWFKSLIQYSFYPVVANLFVYVYGIIMIDYFTLHPGPYTTANVAGMLLMLLTLSVTCCFGILKLGQLVSGIFSGEAGHSAFPGIGGWR
jgi:hypothetical protein